MRRPRSSTRRKTTSWRASVTSPGTSAGRHRRGSGRSISSPRRPTRCGRRSTPGLPRSPNSIIEGSAPRRIKVNFEHGHGLVLPVGAGPRVTAAKDVIDALGLRAHPEGGWYAETWRAPSVAAGVRPPARSSTSSPRASDPTGTASTRPRSGRSRRAIRSSCASGPRATPPRPSIASSTDVTTGSVVQVVVPAGSWQAARSLGAWTLVGCIVSPAFEFDGFELAPPGWEPPTADAPARGVVRTISRPRACPTASRRP